VGLVSGVAQRGYTVQVAGDADAALRFSPTAARAARRTC
jgi:hypothetical protein